MWGTSIRHQRLHCSKTICLPLNISEKFHLQHFFEKLRDAETIITFTSVDTIQKSIILWTNIDHSSKRGPPLFFHSDTSPRFGNSLVQSVNKTHILVVAVKLICLFFLNILSFNFVQTPNKSLRFRIFSRSYVNCPVDVSTNYYYSSTAFFHLFVSSDLCNLLFLSTPVAQMLLTFLYTLNGTT